MIGINLSGAEFGSGKVYGKNYIYPNAKELDYYASKGVELIRLPFKWERMQTTLGGELNQAEVARMKLFLDQAAERGMEVIIDLHNYGRYGGKVIGSTDVPTAKFADFWTKMAGELKDSKALVGYDIMNEPHDMGQNNSWPKIAQAAIDAIRLVDRNHDIYIEGTAWSGASTWKKYNSELAKLTDPSDKLIFEAHQYFDKNGSGTYAGTYDSEGAYPDIGVDRLKPFLDWLAENNLKGFLGEFAVPDNDPRWLTVLDRFLEELDKHDVDGAYWGAGSWWGNYPMGINPRGGVDQPQMAILEKYMDDDQSDTLGGLSAMVQNARNAVTDAVSADPLHKILGTSAAEKISGTDHDDQIFGLGGADTLFGGKGNDTFVFTKLSDSLPTKGDILTDFTKGDRIDLHLLDAKASTATIDAFTFIGAKAFSGHEGELRYVKKGADAFVYGDVNGDKKADFSISVEDFVSITKDSFILT